MNKFGHRLLYIIKTLKLSQAKFAKKIDVNHQVMNRYCNDLAFPGHEFFIKLKKTFPLINLNWLLIGQGGMHLEDKMPVGINKTTLEIFESTYMEFERSEAIEELQTILLNAALEKSVASTYKDFGSEHIFWGILVSNRQQIVSLLLLERILKVAIKQKSYIKATRVNAKKELINIFKGYTLALADRAIHLISSEEKELVIENLNENLSDDSAYIILKNIPIALEKISDHLSDRRGLKH